MVNPLKNLERSHIPKPKIHILTAKQLRRLLVATIRLHPELVPLLAIEVFAGVRPLESEKIRWENVDPLASGRASTCFCQCFPCFRLEGYWKALP